MEKKYEESVRLINWFCEKEYNKVDFEEYPDLTHISLVYSLTEDEHAEIQVYANLPAMCIEYTLDGKIVETDTFKTMEEMEWFFQWMSSGELITVVDNYYEKLHETM